MSNLTRRQSEVLALIQDFIREHRQSPTVREIGDLIGSTSPNGPHCHLRALEKSGLITRTRGVARGIRVVGKCPVCGRSDTETEYRDVPMPTAGHVRVRYEDGGKLLPGKVEAE